MRRVSLFIPLFVCATITASHAVAADDYAIRIARTSKIGSVRKLKGTYSERQTSVLEANGRKIKEETKEWTISLEGEGKVLEVAPTTLASKLAFTVEKCFLTEDGKTSEIVPAGKIIEVKHGAGARLPTFTVDGTPLSEEIGAKLKEVLNVHDQSKPTDDEVFGTVGRRKIGESWGCRMELFLKELDEWKSPARKQDVAASVKLVDVKSVGGVPCTILECTMAIPMDPEAQVPAMPKWLHIQSGKAVATIRTALPIDVADTERSRSGQATMNFVTSGIAPDGMAIVSTTTRTSTGEITFQPIR